MKAYLAVTDSDWFDFLAAQPVPDEVNFWQPHAWGGAFRVLRRGEPLLFKLKSPKNAIAGGGFFERYADLPLSLAWDAFGPKNGAPTRQAVWDRVARLRRSQPPWWEDFTIGCILLSEPFFWPEELWIRQPADFGRTTIRGKHYDLSAGVGAALWTEVVARLDAVPRSASGMPPLPGGYTEPALVRRRIGQGIFRVLVTEAYERKCAVTREKALPVLEAAHIRPFAEVAVHEVTNGLLLRSDVHRLFDDGYVTITPDHRVEVSHRLRDDFNDGENYLRLHGGRILLPADPTFRPDAAALRWHNDKRFRG